jgi:hypothetical protein
MDILRLCQSAEITFYRTNALNVCEPVSDVREPTSAFCAGNVFQEAETGGAETRKKICIRVVAESAGHKIPSLALSGHRTYLIVSHDHSLSFRKHA